HQRGHPGRRAHLAAVPGGRRAFVPMEEDLRRSLVREQALVDALAGLAAGGVEVELDHREAGELGPRLDDGDAGDGDGPGAEAAALLAGAAGADGGVVVAGDDGVDLARAGLGDALDLLRRRAAAGQRPRVRGE